MKKILTATIVLLSLCLSSAIVSAEPVVEDVNVSPDEPERLSTITITATITSDDGIDTVNLKIKECRGTPDSGDLCYTEETHEMTAAGGDTFTIDYDLHYSDTGYFGYYFEVIGNGASWTNIDDITNVIVKAGSSNGGNGGGDDDNGSPGFELIIVIIAIFIGVVLLNRKR